MSPSSITPSTYQVIIQTLEQSLNRSIDDYVTAVQTRAGDLISRGVSPEEVKKMLLADVKNGAGDFQALQGVIGSQIDKALGQTAMDVSNEAIKDLADQFEWLWEPNAKHCDTCQERNGEVKSYDEWEALGLPGVGTTDCGVYCKCTLVPVQQG
jgi:hypothetical protein